MPNILALILAAGRVDELSLLTLDRPKSAVPFGGLYRVIDFALSNLMQSRIGRVGILSQYQSTSLITHIGNGESWDMIGRHRKVTLLPPLPGGKDANGIGGRRMPWLKTWNSSSKMNPIWCLSSRAIIFTIWIIRN